MRAGWYFGVASSSQSVASLEAVDRGELQREGGRDMGECEETGEEEEEDDDGIVIASASTKTAG